MFVLIYHSLNTELRSLSISHSWDKDVVMRVAVIGNQGVTIGVLGKFDLIGVDHLEGRVETLSVDLNHSLIVVHSGGSELSFLVISGVAEMTDFVKGVAVAAQSGLVLDWGGRRRNLEITVTVREVEVVIGDAIVGH